MPVFRAGNMKLEDVNKEIDQLIQEMGGMPLHQPVTTECLLHSLNLMRGMHLYTQSKLDEVLTILKERS